MTYGFDQMESKKKNQTPINYTSRITLKAGALIHFHLRKWAPNAHVNPEQNDRDFMNDLRSALDPIGRSSFNVYKYVN
jgi:hypothetical protein